jgi:hypothetical protein
MGLLSRKPKVSIEGFCREFYDSRVFSPTIAGIDVVRVFLESGLKSTMEADQSFGAIAPAKFQEEMTALRMELFALAWLEKFGREQFTIPQSVFTERYLEEKGKTQIWDSMVEYNNALDRSATLTKTGEEMEGRMLRGRITFLNSFRWGMFKDWTKANIGDPSAPTEEEMMLAGHFALILKRVGVDIQRGDCIAAKVLVDTIANRLGYCDVGLNSEAQSRLGSFIFGCLVFMYEDAKKAIKNLNLQG